jgi:hypothetical protein
MSQPAQKACRATGTIRVARFVKLDSTADHSVLECDANDRIFGISQMGGREAPLPSVTADPPQAAQAGDTVNVYTNGANSVLLQIGSGGCTAGALLESDADGKGVVAPETAGSKRNYGARALAAAAENEYCPVEVLIGVLTTET